MPVVVTNANSHLYHNSDLPTLVAGRFAFVYSVTDRGFSGNRKSLKGFGLTPGGQLITSELLYQLSQGGTGYVTPKTLKGFVNHYSTNPVITAKKPAGNIAPAGKIIPLQNPLIKILKRILIGCKRFGIPQSHRRTLMPHLLLYCR